jgi:hypothetical protein
MTTYPYAGKFETFRLDTNSGCLAQTVPGSYATLGEIDTYVIQVQGTYYMHAQLAFDYDDTSTDLCQIALTLVHLDSLGTVQGHWTRLQIPTVFNGLDSPSNLFSMDISALDVCYVGDIWFVLIEDGSGTSTTLAQDTSPPNAHFEGFYVGA